MSRPQLPMTRKMMLRIALSAIVSPILVACHVQRPQGKVIEPVTHGTWVDDVNRQQEENAEQAKLIVYAHEFESNVHDTPAPSASDAKRQEHFEFTAEQRPRGYRLTPDGQDHVRQIAVMLQTDADCMSSPVIVERSRSSRKWESQHGYPVHFNDELDELRRDVVVAALASFGVPNADELVIIAPAYPTGLNAAEAAAAFGNAMQQSGWQGGALGSGRR